jgi:anti-sigma-K factor RskA
MTTTEDQEDRYDEMIGYCLGELSREQSRQLERRIAEDTTLAAEVVRIRRTLGLLPYAAITEPPPGLRSRVLAAAAAGHIESRRRLPWGALAALAATVALAVVGLDDYRVRRELMLMREVTRAFQEPNVVLSFSLHGMGASAGAHGRAILDLDAKKAALVVRSLPALPVDRVYRLWAMVGEKEVACGQFDAGASGDVVRQFAIPVHEYTEPVRRLIVTIEPRSQETRPLGPTAMVSS